MRGIFVDFGQAAARCEVEAVDRLSDRFSIPVTKLKATSPTAFGTGELVGRNLFLIASALLLGKCHDGLLAIGIHAGTGYYDCSPAFLSRVEVLVQECSNGRVSIVAPFIEWSKDEVYSYFQAEQLPLHETQLGLGKVVHDYLQQPTRRLIKPVRWVSLTSMPCLSHWGTQSSTEQKTRACQFAVESAVARVMSGYGMLCPTELRRAGRCLLRL